MPRAEDAALHLIVAGRSAFASYRLPARGKITIGRADDCDVQIGDDGISRRHARLHVGERIEIEDTGSVNGTYVRDERLEPGKRAELALGEACRLGSTSLVVGGAPRPAAASPDADAATRRSQRFEQAPRSTHAAIAPVVRDPAMLGVYSFVDRIAIGNINVLLLGETGAGKEVVAEAIHARSPRRARPLLRLNCAALSEPLLEAELFGHERGAFTGASHAKDGLLETAHGGTVLLDEAADMPLSVQAKLLRVIETGQLTRVGGVHARHVDVRFVSATNKEPRSEIEQGRLRQDLFFRLAGVEVRVPPLRERPLDVEPLAHAFLARVCAELGRAAPSFAPEALSILRGYAWPGNVRELKNVVERAALLCSGPFITPEHFPLAEMGATLEARATHGASFGPASAAPTQRPPPPDDEDHERARILAVLGECAGNQSRAAKRLGIARSTLVARLDSYGVPRPRK
jgi:DNA-binding NtrC family response regulator